MKSAEDEKTIQGLQVELEKQKESIKLARK